MSAMTLEEALAYLESHVNLEAIHESRYKAPTLDRIRELTGLMGDPQQAYPVIHITGTNGKGSTARMVTTLLVARGLSVGTYTSPDLQRVNERLAWNSVPIGDDDLAELLSSLANLEGMLDMTPSRFELLTAAAFRWFADLAVDAAVVEVGLGGRWDATNVADAAVAVVTNVELDHQDILGPTRRDIAAEKAGIVKPGCVAVIGETDPELLTILRAGAGAGARAADEVAAVGPTAVWRRCTDFACTSNALGVGGRMLGLRTPGAEYPAVFLPLHGAHQGDNAACALAAAEAFFGGPLPAELVEEAFAAVRLPGRMEVVGRHPLVLLDGAHNPAGARAAAATVAEEFGGVEGRVLVVGMLQGRVPEEMLAALGAGSARLVVATSPPSPRALPPDEVAAAARAMGVDAVVVDPVAEAVRHARAAAGAGEMVLVTGSLYVVGSARAALVEEPV